MQKEAASSPLMDKPAHTVYLLPCLLVAACFWNGLSGQFVHDDLFAIKNNPDVTGWTPLLQLFGNDFWGTRMDDARSHRSYRPLCVLSFRLDYAISGGNPVWFHIVNTLLHTVVTLTLTWLCLHVLHTSATCALLASCMFAVHPIHTEAVTGIVGRADVLAAFFFLLSLYTYCRCMTPGPRTGRAVNCGGHSARPSAASLLPRLMFHLMISLLLAAAAMLCKETGLTVLGVSLLLDLTLHGRATARDLRHGKLGLDGSLCLVRCAGLLLGAAALLLSRLWMMNFQQPEVFLEEANPASFSPSLVTRLLTYLYLPAFNLWLLLCPATLSYDWAGGSIPLVSSVSDPRNVTSLVFYTSIAGLAWTGAQRVSKVNKHGGGETVDVSPIMAVGLLVLPFLPASNLFFRVGFVVAERLLYIPSMGYCLLVAHGVQALWSRLAGLRLYVTLLYLLLLVAWATRTLDRNRVWQSRHALFWSGVKELPHNDKMHYNLANLLKDQGQLDQAQTHYRTAIALNPKYASYYLNLGTVLGNKTQARQHYVEALRLRPHHVGALVNLGSLLLNDGDQSGLALVQQALALDPNNFEAVLTMAHALLVNDSLSQAGLYSTRALSLKPDSAKAHLCHGIYLHNTGQTGDALIEYQAALRLEPGDSTALLNSARIYYKDGQLSEAERQLQKALSLDTNCSQCLALLGAVYSRAGNHEQAAFTLARAAKMAPNNTLTSLKYVSPFLLTQTSYRHHHHQHLGVLRYITVEEQGPAATTLPTDYVNTFVFVILSV
ncbi:hypothetical protein BsWGS_12633 [Bradybaena similaris]